jgi:hypothetical protein
MDRLFRENHDIFIFRYKDAIAPHRPASYLEYEAEEMRRVSSVSPQIMRRAVGKVRTNREGDEPLDKDERTISEESSSPV